MGRGGRAIPSILAILCGAGPALADDPFLAGEIVVELEDDWSFAADASEDRLDEAYVTVESSLRLGLAAGWALLAEFTLEPVEDPDPGRDHLFEDEGLFAEHLYLEFERDGVALRAGRLTAPFAVAWDLAPGLYGSDLAGDLELAERLGAAVAAPVGSARISAAAFALDTSALAGSGLRARERPRRGDGGASNTGAPRSVALALDGGNAGSCGEEVEPEEGEPVLCWHVALSRQEGGRGDPEDEEGAAAAVYGGIALAEDAALLPIAELALQLDDEGGRDDSAYATLGAALEWEDWTLALAGTWRRTRLDEGGHEDATLAQVSLGYGFDIGLGVEAGYKRESEAGSSTDVFGFLVGYCLTIPDGEPC
jgi:hypothetical protein